jgi:putative cell wall-binding protein
MKIPLMILLAMLFTISAIPAFSQSPITSNVTESISVIRSSNEIDQKIPDWIKNNAKW